MRSTHRGASISSGSALVVSAGGAAARGGRGGAGSAAAARGSRRLLRAAASCLALAIPASAAAVDAAGDPEAGAKVYTRCEACHTFAYDRTGPRHCGLLGRKAGSVAGFDYSEAMKRSGIVWNAQTLDRFLADPMSTVPGTTMGYAGIADAGERADLIAFLRTQGEGPACRKPDGDG